MENSQVSKIIKNSFSTEVNEVINDFRIKFNLNYFRFFRHFDDGSFINLNSNPYWTEHFYKHDFHNIAWFDKIAPYQYNSGHIMWDTKAQKEDNIVGYDARSIFKFHHGITIINRSEICSDFFEFTTSEDNFGLNDIFIHDNFAIKKFCFFFLEKTSPLIKIAEKNKSKILRQFDRKFLENNKKIQIKRFYIPGQNTYITRKELEVIYLMSEGYSSQEISNQIKTSKRTVDQHCRNILSKLNCNKSVQAVARIAKLGILDKEMVYD